MSQTNPTPTPVTSSQYAQNNTANILYYASAAAIPAHIIMHDKNAVGISGWGLAEVLKPLYEAGIRHVVVVVDAAGQRLVAEATIYRRVDKQSGRVMYWLYPLSSAQRLLRDLLHKYRGDAPRNAKRPLPAAVVAVVPKPK
ncbi:MAG: hypothetical protein ACO2PM_04650 [Pyrobaculum sp.]